MKNMHDHHDEGADSGSRAAGNRPVAGRRRGRSGTSMLRAWAQKKKEGNLRPLLREWRLAIKYGVFFGSLFAGATFADRYGTDALWSWPFATHLTFVIFLATGGYA